MDWVFELPRAANRFDFRTIADVLVTIEDTALESPTYRAETITRLGTTVPGTRVISVRTQFPDIWYALHHSDAAASTLPLPLQTRVADFPPALTALAITDVAFFVASEDTSIPQVTATLSYTPDGGATICWATPPQTLAASPPAEWPAAPWRSLRGASAIGHWQIDLAGALADGSRDRPSLRRRRSARHYPLPELRRPSATLAVNRRHLEPL